TDRGEQVVLGGLGPEQPRGEREQHQQQRGEGHDGVERDRRRELAGIDREPALEGEAQHLGDLVQGQLRHDPSLLGAVGSGADSWNAPRRGDPAGAARSSYPFPRPRSPPHAGSAGPWISPRWGARFPAFGRPRRLGPNPSANLPIVPAVRRDTRLEVRMKLVSLVLLVAVASWTPEVVAEPTSSEKARAARADSLAKAPELLASSITLGEGAIAMVPWMRATLRVPGTPGDNHFAPPHVSTGPKVDGVLDDEVWAQAALLESFTHSRPIEGVRDSLGTTALVVYDDHSLYVAFHAQDDPRRVQAPIVPRDQIWQGDWVGVSIDTYHDRQRSFFLSANPVGIQMDGVDQEGRDTDMAPDFQYSSRGRVTTAGYEVEMEIPFKTLRFIPGDT